MEGERSMATILATATTPADHGCTQGEAKEFVRAWLGESDGRLRGALELFDRVLVERRSAAIPVADVFVRRGFGANNDLYVAKAVELATRVTQRVLDAASLSPRDVDLFVSTSCTGFA